MKVTVLIFILSLSIKLCFTQVLTISVPADHFKIDESRSLIVSHIENIESYSDLSGFTEVVIQLDEIDYLFNTTPEAITYSNSYSMTKESAEYLLYFTQLPIISIVATDSIVDEPKRLANFTYSDNTEIIQSHIGIELRGGSSQSYPKKTYDLEFWQDTDGDEATDVQFGNMRSDDDWILDALYNEPLRIRSYIANKLWLDMHSPYYKSEEAESKSGVDVSFVELFLDGQYNGVYNLSEQVDRKLLKLKKFNDDIRGELYKGVSWGATTFTRLPNYNNNNRLWSGYEYDYPEREDTTEWLHVYNLTDFIINATEEEFDNSIWDRFQIDNYIDYFIFLNVIRATDNTGKNIYLGKYKSNEPYFYIPWDLDGSFGTIWDGSEMNITDGIIRNAFQDRVIVYNPQNCNLTTADRWFDYRDNILSNDQLLESIESIYTEFTDNKVYEREAIVYPNYSFGREHLDYTTTWLKERLIFLDDYFDALVSIENVSGDLVEDVLYPNPATSNVYFKKNHRGKECKIYNSYGRLIHRQIILENHLSIESFIPGLYILTIDEKSYRLIVN